MFIVYRANELNTLLLKAYKIIEKNPLSNIFEQEIFIHDNKILFQYLNIFIANQIGISCNFRLYHPDYFIWKLLHKVSLQKESKNIFNKSIMSWKIMKILDEKKICEYIRIKDNQERKFKFSFLMANVFEQYLLHRPNWITNWENKKCSSDEIDKSDQWQIKLWRETRNAYTNTHPFSNHFPRLLHNFQVLIKKNKLKKNFFPNRCFIISNNNLNPFFFKIFKKISSYFNIYFLQITPYKKNKFSNPLTNLWTNDTIIDKLHVTRSKNIKIIDCFKINKYSSLLNNIKNDFIKKQSLKKKDYYHLLIIQSL